MRYLERARVRDENTSGARYFIEVEHPNGSTSGSVRFSRRQNAERVANAINKAYADEGRLLGEECTCQ